MITKTKILTGILVVVILVAGGWWIWNSQTIEGPKGICGPKGVGANYDVSYCDKSCNVDNDCKFTCGCGAINKNEICHDEGIIYDCVDSEVKCKDNRCIIGKELIEKATITKEQAITIASQTEEVEEFLKLYPDAKVIVEQVEEGYCTVTGKVAGDDVRIDCNTAYGKESGWVVAYYFGDSWEHSKSTAVRIGIDGQMGKILAKYPKLEYFRTETYCEYDEDCKCFGELPDGRCCDCTNFIHLPIREMEEIKCLRTYINCKCLNNTCVAVEKQVTITTDKTEYEQGETIKIIVTNSLDYSVVPQALLTILPDGTKRTIKYLGENYGIGLIEKFEEGTWIGIEPVWRCGSSCFAECIMYKHSFEPNETRVFEWNQTVLTCNKIDRTEKVENAGTGKYRVSSEILLNEGQTYKKIYSNEFTIK